MKLWAELRSSGPLHIAIDLKREAEGAFYDPIWLGSAAVGGCLVYEPNQRVRKVRSWACHEGTGSEREAPRALNELKGSGKEAAEVLPEATGLEEKQSDSCLRLKD
jgi:hypothetical protein